MKTTTVVIGAGHAGLAVSHCLTDRSIDHVVLERGEVANSWRHERWDSLRLLTPNWQCRLPGYDYDGDDPDGFLTMPDVVEVITRYGKDVAAPVQEHTTVTSVRRSDRGDGGYVVTTDRDAWECRAVVLASGAFNIPKVPAFAEAVPSSIRMLTPTSYRRPDEVDEGGVLVVGASASGVQIAAELARSGRPVTMAVGEHVRGPRVYRGRDIHWWMEACGLLDERYDEVDDIVRARHTPSMQLVGTPERSTLDLNALTAMGVQLVGKLAAIREGRALFSGSLRNKCELADLKLDRLLDTIDEWATTEGLDDDVLPPERFPRTVLAEPPVLGFDLARSDIRTILWATGFRADHSFVDAELLDGKGVVRHDGGVVTDSPGLYLIGGPFTRRRKSSFIDGARDDAPELVGHLAAFLSGRDIS